MTSPSVAPRITPAQAGALINASRYAEAIALLTDAVDQQQMTDPELLYLLGTAHYRNGNVRSAQQAFGEAVTTRPNHAYALYGLALIAKEQRDADAAIRLFRAAIEADPSLTAARRHLDELQGRTEAAATAAAGAVPSEPSSLAELLDVRGRPRLGEEEMAGPVVWTGRPVARFIAGSLIAAVGFIVLPLILGLTTGSLPPGVTRDGLAQLWRLAAAVSWPAAVVLVVTGYLRVATRRYVIREHRVEVFAGILNRKHVCLWLHDVERPIVVKQNIWQLALGIGAVELHSTVLPTSPRHQFGRPGKLLLAGLSIGVAEDVAGFVRTAVLWERRRMVLTFVSAR